MLSANSTRCRLPVAACKSFRSSRMACRAENEPKIAEDAKNLAKDAVEDASANGRTQMKEDMSNVTHPATPASAIGDTLMPRVEEIRGKYLQQGTTDFQQLMKFSGPAPELINGRLAMMGFLAAVAAEVNTHKSIFKQFAEAPAVIVGFSVLIMVASIIPMVRGTKRFDDGFGEGVRPGFNVTNELINGRAAMVGIALLVIFETGARSALF